VYVDSSTILAVELVGRPVERERLVSLLGYAAQGLSAVLVVEGEAGVGKTVLLDDLVATAASRGVSTFRLVGLEPETPLGYAALHRLLQPFRSDIERLPEPQRDALRSALGLIGSSPPDRFLVGLGVLTLLADAASAAPLLVVIDDANWLDQESLVVLGFAARRLHAEGVVMVFAVRAPSGLPAELFGLPEMVVGGLAEDASLALLAALTEAGVARHVGARLAVELRGNPLALVEVVRELSPGQMAGGESLPDPLPVGAALQGVFDRRVARLAPSSRVLLALAAAEPTAPPSQLWRASARLGIDPDAAAFDVGDVLEVTGDAIVFRHPLARAAAYRATPAGLRRQVHQTWAAVADEGTGRDRVAWHLANAAASPDDGVAARLEEAAEQVRARGGYAATATFLSRAADLSVDPVLKARRYVAAASAELTAGAPQRAAALLDQAERGALAEADRLRAERLQADLAYAMGGTPTDQFLAAGRSSMPIDPAFGRETVLRALEFAIYAGRNVFAPAASTARQILAGAPIATPPLTSVDGLLYGLLERDRSSEAAPLFRGALDALRERSLADESRLPWMPLGTMAAVDLLDLDAKADLVTEYARIARERGALATLPVALINVADACVYQGRYAVAEAALAESRSVSVALGSQHQDADRPGLADVSVLASRGHHDEAWALGRAVAAALSSVGAAGGVSHVRLWLAVLEIAFGNYGEALDLATYVFEEDLLAWGTPVLPNLVEAAVRSDKADMAERALARLEERVEASGALWGLGLLARSRALVSAADWAEQHYRDAIDLLERTTAAPDLARAHLLYGEWLRRERRRREARHHLRRAYDMFGGMGAEAFARRARIELNATGERARQRQAGTETALTPQEAQIAGLVTEGLTNRDIAARLFVSPATVEYHLRKMFRKLGVSSRTQLAGAMAAGGP
jgi:DNA-binding CsgD family transcriptional regulator